MLKYLPGGRAGRQVTTMGLQLLYALWREEDGLSTVEYALLLALIVLAVAAAFSQLGGRMSDNMTSASTKVGTNPNP